MLGRVAARIARAMPPEKAHEAAIKLLATGLVGKVTMPPDPMLRTTVAGLTFSHPVGLAAGFDKNAEVVDPVLGLGFSHAELGTVTPKPQPGNPLPRLFRLTADRALINRFGFNSEGANAVRDRLRLRRERNRTPGIVGINIGANKESDDRVADYVAGIGTFAGLADYYTVNISSPNTPGLRDLQGEDAMKRLLGAVMAARTTAHAETMPIFVKIAPDLDDIALQSIVEAAKAHGVDGLIVSNTTLSRNQLTDPRKTEAGGMSGRPLFERATAALARTRDICGPDMALIGVGGVASAQDAAEKIFAGADLVQFYTGMVFESLGLPARIVDELPAVLRAAGHNTPASARDTGVSRWSARFDTFANA